MTNIAASPTISAQNNQILASTRASVTNGQPIEYGVEQKLTSLTGGPYKPTTVRANGSSTTFTPTFTWNSTDGYTIGVSHGHPSNGAPSPADALWAASNLNNPQLLNGKSLYLNNISVTVVTEAGLFVITVKDWAALQNYYNLYYISYGPQGRLIFNATYANHATAYQTNNPGATYQDITAYALLKMYGSAINLYRSYSISSKLEPLRLGSQGDLLTVICL